MTNTRTGVWFDGVNDHLTIADHAELSWGTAWSISLWFAMDADCAAMARLMSRAAYAEILLEEGNSGTRALGIGITGGGVHSFPNIKFQPHTLYNLTITLADDGADCDYVIYVDGVAKATGTFAGENLGGDVANALYFAINTDAASNPYLGYISNIFVSKDVLTAAEALAIYASGAGIIDYAAISDHGAEWNCDEDTATTCENDSSANIDLTLTNGPIWQTEWDFKGKDSGVWDTTDVSHRWPDPIYVTQIEWIDATVADQSLLITDWADNVVFASEADADDFIDRAYPDEWYNGIKIVTLGGGRLLIHIG